MEEVRVGRLATGELAVLDRIETYLDAVPRSAADPEPVGPFTLFRPRGAWPYYARPRLGLQEPISADDVRRLRTHQRALGLHETIEWVVETTPSLSEAARNAGLTVVEYPLMVLESGSEHAVEPPDGIAVRFVAHNDPDFTRAYAVAAVGFGASGTAIGPESGAERDAKALSTPAATVEFMRGRARDGFSISAAAFDEGGPVSVGTHQPVGTVTEVVGVATLPVARRRGLGAAVTSALLQDAIARGVTTVFLSADGDDVARVYERLGFRRLGSAGAAEAP